MVRALGRSVACNGDLAHLFSFCVVPHRRNGVEVERLSHCAADALEKDRHGDAISACKRNAPKDVECVPTAGREAAQGLAARPVEVTKVYERSPTDNVADSAPSSSSQASTTSTTPMTARDSHSDSTRTSLRDRSNEIDDRSKRLASRRMSRGARAASTETRISTIGSSQLRSSVADRGHEGSQLLPQPRC